MCTLLASCLILSTKIYILFLAGPYVLTNNFAQDFHELAKNAGFPELRVVPRPCRPKRKKTSSAGLESTQPPGKGDKKDGELYTILICILLDGFPPSHVLTEVNYSHYPFKYTIPT